MTVSGLVLITGSTAGSAFASHIQSQQNLLTQGPNSGSNVQNPAQNPTPNRITPGGGSTTDSASPSSGISDSQFLIEAAQGGMAEVQLGQLAQQRAASSAVKQFGLRMVQDHTQANNQLLQLSTQKGVTLPPELDARHAAVREQLSQLSGSSFDQAYMNAMIQDHIDTISLFQREAEQGQAQDVKAWASSTLPTLQEHLQMARTVAASITSTGTSNSGVGESASQGVTAPSQGVRALW